MGEAGLICPDCDQMSLSGERHAQCKTKYGLDGLATAWEYEGIVKKLLHTIKYDGITHAIQELMEDSLAMMTADQQRFGTFFRFLFGGELSSPHITYVPMVLRKEKKRGFNHARLIAQELGKIIGCRVVSLLEKIKDTGSQTELTKEARLENVKNSFALRNSFSRLPKQVVLVDDVFTTGATMKECCKVLKKAGAKEVWGFTLARTP